MLVARVFERLDLKVSRESIDTRKIRINIIAIFVIVVFIVFIVVVIVIIIIIRVINLIFLQRLFVFIRIDFITIIKLIIIFFFNNFFFVFIVIIDLSFLNTALFRAQLAQQRRIGTQLGTISFRNTKRIRIRSLTRFARTLRLSSHVTLSGHVALRERH